MKNQFSKITLLFAFVATSLFTSCSDDDDKKPAADLQVTLTEVGHGTPPHAHAGEDLHLEGEILAEAGIAGVTVEIHSETNPSAPEITATYADYNGLLNATFHKHIDIPASQPAGIYHVHLTVVDQDGNPKSAEAELEILPVETNDDITINITELGTGAIGSSTVQAGSDLHIDGTITSLHPIATIAVEIHSEDNPSATPIEVTYTSYAGQTNVDFHQHIDIPADQPTGHYHFAVTVTDEDGASKTAEYELEIQ